MAPPSTFVRVRLNPVADSRVPWAAQMVLALVLVAYGLALVLTGGRPEFAVAQPWLQTLFLVFAVGYLGYVFVRATPIFGTQTYLELTPDYLVHKRGLFRPKATFGAEEIAQLDYTNKRLRITNQQGQTHELNLRQVRGARKRVRLRHGLEEFARRNQIKLVAGEARSN